MNNLVEINNVFKTYADGAREVPVLKGVSLKLASDDMLAIVGSSGSGKSTLLHVLGGLDTADSGELQVAGEQIGKLNTNQLANWRNQHLGFVYQFHHLLNEFTALENVAMPALIAGLNPKDAEQAALALLERVGLSERANHLPSQLSGGERQRIAIARALVNKPKLVLADEPTGNLDEDTAALIYKLMVELNRELGTAFIVVTHDYELARALPRTMAMDHGTLVEAS
ncbi:MULTISPECIES: lipoprotein-releasing ABC transporter ATP-binding protein LolD [Gammaproteobacteria]|uniref:lipoprotein-releasing ABC transporter ATP-binding protein LolD n=1 Tax=Gammaproteobacteria TaxID=1236 RepID=UPI000DCFF2F1|nr:MULTISPECIES: lipoprotein-releasing ABC transporter ATP-binding protein LolD [Gammaproteobacteria]RTE86941.1 lipoprotein-releasing ABC transporter ATP-binding protein LolD [Aliidiomarina sp. B3213]TCZ93269.1 lipoprotein-releasing ABC transporter ATP-binding protein LolD [Lysobacter sp. N42]